MIKKILFTLNIGIICLVLSQFLIIEFDRSSFAKAESEALKKLKENNKNYTEENLERLKDSILLKKAKNRLKAVKIRKITDKLNENEKLQLLKNLKNEKLKESPNKFLEIEIIKSGYTPITYVNEKIFGLTSYKQLKFSKNYFNIILLVTSFIFVSILFFYFKKGENKIEKTKQK